MSSSEVEKLLQVVKDKALIQIEYFDKNENREDSALEISFIGNYRLLIQSMWRIYDTESILAMETERHFLSNNEAPKKDWQNLPLDDSLITVNLENVRKKCLGAKVRSVKVNKTNDIYIELNNGIIIQGLIHCRLNSYMYYGLFLDKQEIVKCSLDWENN